MQISKSSMIFRQNRDQPEVSESKLYMWLQKPKFDETSTYQNRLLLLMIKPIVYHNFEEKELLERKLMAIIPQDKRLSASEALMNIFYTSKKKKRAIQNQNRNDKS